MGKRRSLIFFAKDLGEGLESFAVKEDGRIRKYAQLWYVRRVLNQSAHHFIYANVNGDRVIIDATAPTFIKRIPRDAKPVNRPVSILLQKQNSHDFGHLRLTEDEMENFIKAQGINIYDEDKIIDSTIVFDYAPEYGFLSHETKMLEYEFTYIGG